MKINRNELITAFAFVFDFLEIGMRNVKNVSNHNKRVCLISMLLGESLSLDAASLFDLYAYAILHDNGISHDIYNNSMLLHCVQGEENLVGFPFLEKRESIIKYHHEFYDGSGVFGMKGDGIPLFSQIIAVADAVAETYQTKVDWDDIASIIAGNKGVKYAPDVCEAFALIETNVSFWLSLDDIFIGDELEKYVYLCNMDLRLSEFLSISEIFGRITDAISPYTKDHSQGLSRKVALMSDYYCFNERTKTKLLIAANLHDIGKLAIPTSILYKQNELTKKEAYTAKSHTFYTRKSIEAVKGFEDIAEWASNHHEKLDGTGYPYGLTALDLSFESQLLACLNIYQSLIENNSTRAKYSHAKAIKNMEAMSKRHEINWEITKDIAEHLG